MIDVIVVNLKARFQPMHRHDLEDEFLEYCENQQLNLEIVGGGTQIDNESGEPLECDIEIGGTQNHQMTDTDIKSVAQFFNNTFAPKGSSLQIFYQDVEEPKVITIGHLEGLSLMMNGTDLPNEVYENHDINDVIEKCNELMVGGDLGQMYSYCESQHTYLYFYGKNFELMKSAITPFLGNHPLCQKSKITQIA